MDSSINIVRELEQFFEPYRMMFKEPQRGGGEAASHQNVSEKKTSFWGGGQLFADFRFSRRFLEPNSREKQGMTM